MIPFKQGYHYYFDEIFYESGTDFLEGFTYLYTKSNSQYDSHYFENENGKVVVFRFSKFRKSEH